MRAVYDEALVWDTHSGFCPDPSADLENLEQWRSAGVTFLSVNVGFDLFRWEQTIQTLAAFRRWIATHDDRFVLADSVAAIRDAKYTGRMAIAFDLEGMNVLDGRIEMLQLYRDLGVRQILFAYNRNNGAGGGCHDADVGLTDFGRAAIDEMNRLGITVDVSHCSRRTSLEAIAHSKKPVIFSHSNPRTVWNHERNIDDEQIVACATGGGVIGVVGLNHFLGPGDAVERMVDHVEYLLKLAGPAHVGIGLDYAFPVDGTIDVDALVKANPEYWPLKSGYGKEKVEFAPPTALPAVAQALLNRGHAEDVVRGVLGENFARVASETW
ncbi:MAG TPA: membrane dipeptidase [Candidatus Baltobacteraceae bacterium]|nr:membrane dipeptidase [Candidatus Baltobacteraceae bacterium]